MFQLELTQYVQLLQLLQVLQQAQIQLKHHQPALVLERFQQQVQWNQLEQLPLKPQEDQLQQEAILQLHLLEQPRQRVQVQRIPPEEEPLLPQLQDQPELLHQS